MRVNSIKGANSSDLPLFDYGTEHTDFRHPSPEHWQFSTAGKEGEKYSSQGDYTKNKDQSITAGILGSG